MFQRKKWDGYQMDEIFRVQCGSLRIIKMAVSDFSFL